MACNISAAELTYGVGILTDFVTLVLFVFAGYQVSQSVHCRVRVWPCGEITWPDIRKPFRNTHVVGDVLELRRQVRMDCRDTMHGMRYLVPGVPCALQGREIGL